MKRMKTEEEEVKQRDKKKKEEEEGKSTCNPDILRFATGMHQIILKVRWKALQEHLLRLKINEGNI